MVDVRLLSDAISALELLTKGRAPEPLHALAAGFALDCLSYEKELGKLFSKHLAETAQGLFRIGRGDIWKLGPEECGRLMAIIDTVQEIIEFSTCKPTTLH